MNEWMNNLINAHIQNLTSKCLLPRFMSPQSCASLTSVWSTHLGSLTSWWRGQTGPGELFVSPNLSGLCWKQRGGGGGEGGQSDSKEDLHRKRKKRPCLILVTEEWGKNVLFRMSFTTTTLTSHMASWRQMEHAAAIFVFLSLPACVSEAIMSLVGSCRHQEDALSHACLLSTNSVFIHSSNCMDWTWNHMGKSGG